MGTIPLVALSMRQVPEPDILGNAAKLSQIQGLNQANQQQAALAPGQQQAQQQQLQAGQQSLQGGQIELQQKQIALQDQQALTKAMQQWDGKDYTQIPALVIKNGGSANAVFSAAQNIIGQKEKLSEIAKNDATAQSDQVGAQIKQHDEYRGRIQAIINAPKDQQQDLWDKEVTNEENTGQAQPGQFSHTYPGDDAAKALSNGFALASQLATEAKNQQDAKNQEAERAQAAANAAETARHNRANEAIQSGLGTGGDAMVDMVGQNKIDLATALSRMPPGAKKAFAAQLQEKYPDYNQGTFGIAKKVGESATSGQIGQNLTAFNTAIEHANQLSAATDALNNGNVNALNKVGNALGYQFGSDKTTNFNVIKNALSGEISKVFKGGGATDAEIESVQKPFDTANSPQQLKGAIQTAVALMQSKRQALQAQYQAGVQGKPNFGGGAQGGGPASNAAPPPGATHTARGSDGKLHWTDDKGQKDYGVAQ